MSNVTLAQLTMNAGEDIPGSAIKWNLKNNAQFFKRIIIVDGNLTKEAKKFYNGYDNVEVINSPWVDSHIVQYRKIAEALRQGEWCLYLDCDEVLGPKLAEFCNQGIGSAYEEQGANIFYVASVLYISVDGSGRTYLRAGHKPESTMPNHGHFKRILFKKDSTLDFIWSGPHVTPTHRANGEHVEKGVYLPLPYYHLKTVESYITNDCLYAVLNPMQERYTPEESSQFKIALRESGVYSMRDFRQATLEKRWSQSLHDFAYAYRKDVDRPISRLYWWYFLIEHPAEPRDEEITWEYATTHALAEPWRMQIEESLKNTSDPEDYLLVPTTPRKLVGV